MMWFILLYMILVQSMFLLQELCFVQAGNVTRLILQNGTSPCEGHIAVYHDGTWGYAGDTEWSRSAEEVVCRSAHCGKHVSTENTLRPVGSKVWINDFKCNGRENYLWKCAHPGWGASIYRKDTMKWIKCSNEIIISLDGFKCAGAVKYSTDGGKTSGYICDDNWGPNEANRLCRRLGCGTATEVPHLMVWREFENSAKIKIDCSGMKNPADLWHCATSQDTSSCSGPASVKCSGHWRLQLKGNTPNVCHGRLEVEEDGSWRSLNPSSPGRFCQHMYCGTSHSVDGRQLKCTDNVTVGLMDKNKPSKCYGAVYVMVNASSHPVCGSKWTSKDAELVCRELNCGQLVSDSSKPSSIKNGIMDRVNCSGSESSLWFCGAKRDKQPFSCSSQAYVVCADSIDVRLADGLGRCAGRVEVQYEGRWRRVDRNGWTDINSDVVCNQLKCGNKRKSPNPDYFSQGSGDFLGKHVKCRSDASHISECVKDFSKTASRQTSVTVITCEEHQVVFLKGNHSCSGTVGIERGGTPYWLSGSKETWNQASANAVCQQMHCGKALNFNSVHRTQAATDIWDASYMCSSNNTSVFECKNRTLPPDHYDSVAALECSGTISITLTDDCWGNVNVCVGGDCGDVCADSWTVNKSSMLCENLGCGTPIGTNREPEERGVIVKSLHCTTHTTNVNQCNLVLNSEKDTSCDHRPAYVVCSGHVKTRISTSRHKCIGTVEIHSEGQWLPVCIDALRDIETQKVICREEKCGQAVNVSEHFGPKTGGLRVISQIQCGDKDRNSFGACTMTSDQHSCYQGVLQCSDWRKMELKHGDACSGNVFVHSERGRQAVSIQGLTEVESNRLCQHLKCGSVKSNESTVTKLNTDLKKNFSCEGVKDPVNIWACEKQDFPSTRQLYVECHDEPRITLSEKCAGEVRINNISVCSTHWNMDYSHLVCQELDCIRAISFDMKPSDPNQKHYLVHCEDYHHKLGQCNRFMSQCEGGLVSIFCAGNLKFKTTEKCGGQIMVNYRNQWENVCLLSFPSEQKENLCRHLSCPGHNDSLALRNSTPLVNVSLETALDCKTEWNMEYCVKSWSCGSLKPAEIYCNGYGRVTKPPITKSIILGVGLLFLVVMIVFVCMKKARELALSKTFDTRSANHDDVISKAEKGHHKIRSETEHMMEADKQSISSYDDIDEADIDEADIDEADIDEADIDEADIDEADIDEAVDVQSLTPQDTTAATAGENALSEGGASCEVDSLEESYDDIEGCPEIILIHNIPQNAPDSVAMAPLGLMPEGGDRAQPRGVERDWV
ncbi:scavenger receptor cysteine-rich type 1 protein M160 [Antennarius striatus]|uniref:scavenger receptor cysteine-rich type 1 protein M160 n=1 Tax=Antennarius striatus TaxID=241820 RepID=UPI0035B2B613